ncbi:MAG: glycoside hydrolase family 3 N-terminal domain-containing protein [Ferrimonas sp.]
MTALTLRQQIAQKLMLDLRFYQASANTADAQPVTQLHPDLATLLSETDLGGIILFAENCQNVEQLRQLTEQLQNAAQRSTSGLPLLISIDQEGGRVMRTPRAETTSFSGNMAIGASAAEHGDYFARLSATVLAQELALLGINCNHAPVVDVNSNPQNPVINVRAFSEQPDLVATLGLAQVQAFEQNNIFSTLKHFPGHGDSASDSHTGLPRVEHARDRIERVELAPFKAIIQQHSPAMIMTAHIQYPALDNSLIHTRQGGAIIPPATMSRAIIDGCLRQQLGYQGVVISDAMDMAAIAAHFDEAEAVILAFAAGIDIALMPIKIRTADDLPKLSRLIDAVTDAIEQGRLDPTELAQSAQRIGALKQRLPAAVPATTGPPLSALLASPQHRRWEQQLALAAITPLHGQPIDLPSQTTVAIVMPDLAKAHALGQALQQRRALHYLPLSLHQADLLALQQAIAPVDCVIGGFISPRQSAAEFGGIEDLTHLDETRLIREHRPQDLMALLAYAKKQQIPTIFISLRTPYEIQQFGQYADWALASYSYHFDHQAPLQQQYQGSAYDALAQVLLQQAVALGQAPVTLIRAEAAL